MSPTTTKRKKPREVVRLTQSDSYSKHSAAASGFYILHGIRRWGSELAKEWAKPSARSKYRTKNVRTKYRDTIAAAKTHQEVWVDGVCVFSDAHVRAAVAWVNERLRDAMHEAVADIEGLIRITREFH